MAKSEKKVASVRKRSKSRGKGVKPPVFARGLVGESVWKAYSYYRRHHPELWPRDYKLEYKHYEVKRKHLTAERVKLRQRFARMGLVKVGDGKQIHHKNGDPTDNRMSNLKILTHCQHRKQEGRKCHTKAVTYTGKKKSQK